MNLTLNMRILVLGKHGQLGRSLKKIATKTKSKFNFVFVGREEFDLSDINCIINYFKNHRFDIIINCAAYTFVDKAESEKKLADKVNHLAVKKIAEIANNCKTKLIHISTDYVFDGESDNPYIESDETNPINVYGKTKLAGEQAIFLAMPNDAIIIRTSRVYSEFGNNFVDTILKLSKEREELNIVFDQLGNPTYANDLAMAILQIISNEKFHSFNEKTQIFHYSNKGSCNWYAFAKEVVELASINCTLIPVKTENYPTIAIRPKNTLMNKDKISKEFGVKSRDWKTSLKDCLEQIALNVV